MIRHTVNTLEIISVLKELQGSKRSFTIWQRNSVKELLFQVKATLLRITEDGEMTFKVDDPLGVVIDSEVFFAVESSLIVYKSVKIQVKEGLLFCELPDELKYKERRKSIRRRMKKREHKEIEIVFSSNKSEEGEKKIVTKLIDISEGGARFLISRETIETINLQETFHIKSLADDIVINYDKGVIVSAKLHKGQTIGHGELYSVGVMFV